ncbi:SCO family protein [Motiliproteus sp. SC1-56]|uniref:SCO family protein n=1 Tax=Motiliproteus sp. SC1-56 TaxID=2799565 RepID=UPI001A8DDF1D|nr:SCO family protein [Motiliproteus sp. SC1-56]
MGMNPRGVLLGFSALLAVSLAGTSQAHQAHEGPGDSGNARSEQSMSAPEAGDGDHARHGKAGADHSAHQGVFDKPAVQARPITVDLVDIDLVDQEGRALSFAREAVGDKLIALNIFYSTCTTVCPVTSAIFAELQDRLGARLGEEVHLISVTVDPTTDTPARLKAYAGKHGAKPGWLWLTGQKRAVEQVLEGLGLYTDVYTDHPSAVLVGDPLTDEWHRFWGFPGPEQIDAQLHRLEAARANPQGHHHGQDFAAGDKP